MARDIIVQAPAAGGGLQVMLGVGLVVLLAAGAATLVCLVGAVFGLAGLVLAVNHPGGKGGLAAAGLALNVLALLTMAILVLYWLYTS